ncbi:MAG: hypothetical protein IKS51_00580 [Erysipelotrichaceae bacterium]|nr:hypothetical protein [Erysipelotrichaceae bacterium]
METVRTEDLGVEIELIDISAKENRNTGFTLIQLNALITNRSEKELTAVSYELQLLDENGELIKAYHRTYFGEDKSLSLNESVKDYMGFQDKLEKQPASFALKVTEVKDVEELPLVHLPLPDEFLYQAIGLERLENELPIKIYVRIDHMGAEDIAEIEDEETIRKLTDLFCNVKIANETDTFVTDNYNLVIFYFTDGTQKGISLNLYNLEIQNGHLGHIYELNDFGPFWKACTELAEPEYE